jgi:tetratricopeptide (TPR) repeat protein
MNVRLKVVAGSLVALVALGGCSRNRQEAALLAQNARKEVDLNPEGAASKYEQAIQLDPTNHDFMFALAMVHEKRKEWSKLEDTLKRASALAPTYANYSFWRGYAKEQLIEKREATWDDVKEPMSKCIELDPNYAECYWRLGEAYYQTKDEQKALEFFTKAVEHAPENLQMHRDLAALYLELGFREQAAQVVKEAKSYAKEVTDDKGAKRPNPEMVNIHMLQAEVFRDDGKDAEQIAELKLAQQAAVGTPHEIPLLFNVGAALAASKTPQPQEAVQKLKGFLSRGCKSPALLKKYKAQCDQATTLVGKLDTGK